MNPMRSQFAEHQLNEHVRGRAVKTQLQSCGYVEIRCAEKRTEEIGLGETDERASDLRKVLLFGRDPSAVERSARVFRRSPRRGGPAFDRPRHPACAVGWPGTRVWFRVGPNVNRAMALGTDR